MKRDPRINAKAFTWRSYLAAFLLMAFLCTASVTVYIAQSGAGIPEWPVMLALTGFVLFISAVGMGLFALYRRVLMRPVRQLSQAAQQVAKGDFSVRMPPRRRDGKKDEIEVLFEDFNTMVAELGSTETLKTDFIANVSHEMKTPLAVIKNYAELLQAGEVSDDRRVEYAAAIEDSAGKMTELITNILRLNRIENQKIVPELAEFDLPRQLTDCILQFEDRWEAKNLELNIDLEDSAPIKSDASLLELVWNNLLSNAIKFTEPGGTISVRERTEGEKLVVTISDTGCGMDAASVGHIFDKFYQGDTSHATEGNGLGLALVQRVLTLLGGEVTVESEQGRGSTFTVMLKMSGTN